MHLHELLQTANPAMAEDFIRQHPVAIVGTVAGICATLFSALLGALKWMVDSFVKDVKAKLAKHETALGEHAVSIEASVRDIAAVREATERIEISISEIRALAGTNAESHEDFASRLGALESKIPAGEILAVLKDVKARLASS